MPFFSFSIDTPKETAWSDKQKTKIKLCPGIIHRVVVRVPPGSRGTLHVFVSHHLHQIVPCSSGEDFHGDDMNIDYREFYPLAGLDTQLDVYTWNASTVYDHEVILMFGVLPEWVLMPMLKPPETFDVAKLGFEEIEIGDLNGR